MDTRAEEGVRWMKDKLIEELEEVLKVTRALEEKVEWLILDREAWKSRALELETKLLLSSGEKPGGQSSGPSS